MRSPEDRTKHQSLIQELIDLFLHEGFSINGADDIEGYYPPIELRNDHYGDQEDKMPDIYAYDPQEGCYIIGEAKTGKNDFETEHALTQYNVYLDQIHPSIKKHARVYFIVPSLRVSEFNTLITHYLHPELWPYVVVVQSQQWQD